MYFSIIAWATFTYLQDQGWNWASAFFAGCGIALALMSAGGYLIVAVVRLGSERKAP